MLGLLNQVLIMEQERDVGGALCYSRVWSSRIQWISLPILSIGATPYLISRRAMLYATQRKYGAPRAPTSLLTSSRWWACYYVHYLLADAPFPLARAWCIHPQDWLAEPRGTWPSPWGPWIDESELGLRAWAWSRWWNDVPHGGRSTRALGSSISLVSVILLVSPREYLKEGTQVDVSPSGTSEDNTVVGSSDH